MLLRTATLVAAATVALASAADVGYAATEAPALEQLAGVAPIYCTESADDWLQTVRTYDIDPAAWGFTAWTSAPEGIYLDPDVCRGLNLALADPSGATFESTLDWRWYVARGVAVLAHETGHFVFATWNETLAECWGVVHWRALMLALGIPPAVRGRAVHVPAQAPLGQIPPRLDAGLPDRRTLWELLLAFHRSGDPSMRSRPC